MQAVGRSLQAYLAFSALLGWSGCLLFTDPINKAPHVSIVPPQGDVVVGTPADFRVDNDSKDKLSDDRDSPSELVIEWAEFDSTNEGCDWITKPKWASDFKTPPGITPLDRYAPYPFNAQDRTIACVCVRATDRDGAWSFTCDRVAPVDAGLLATITDDSNIASDQSRPLCSEVSLSAEQSTYPKGDQIQFDWAISYGGSDPNGKNVQLGDCSGLATSLQKTHRCFYAAVPGLYTVTLTITDTTTNAPPSTPASYLVNVATDTPPCLQQTDPDLHAQLIMLSTSKDLGATYTSRPFKVLSASDDCEPYPVPVGSSKQPTQFVWSIYDATQSPAKWVYPANTTDSLTISQSMFLKALPGDAIKVRVEARDAAVQKQYLSGVSACSADTDVCCGASGCTGTPQDCIRWTTWTVSFEP